MKLFKKENRPTHRGPTLTDQVCKYLDSRHRNLAEKLNKRFAHTPVRRIRCMLIAGCVLVSAYLLWLIIGAF